MFNFSPKIVNDGLVLALDAANPKSYTSGSTVWRDLGNFAYSATKAGSQSPTYPLWNPMGYFTFLSGSLSNNESRFTTNQNIQSFSTLSVFAWYRTSAILTNKTILRLENSDFDITLFTNGIMRWAAGSNFNDIGVNVSVPTMANGLWHNTGFTYDGDNLKAYFDVNNVGNASRGSIVNTQSALLNIGTRNDSFFDHFEGDIANIFIYNKVLSPSEILQNYNALKARFGLT
jgi:hypothetical protein